MKSFCALSIAMCIVTASCTWKQETTIQDRQDEQQISLSQVDSVFNTYFGILDSLVTNKFSGKPYPLDKIQEAIAFMEEISNIQSQAEGTYIGRLRATSEDYNNWLNWYNQNKLRLRWDKAKQEVVLVE